MILKNETHQAGDVLDYTNSTGATQLAGTPVMIGNKLGILLADVLDGKDVGAKIKGAMRGWKVTGALSAGDTLYWDPTGDPIGGTVGSGAATGTETETILGEVVLDAASGDVEVIYLLNEAEGLGTGNGLVEKVLAGTVEFSADAAQDLPIDLPAGSVVKSVSLNLDTLIVGSTAVKVGIGIATDEDKYGKTTGFTKNLKVDTIPAHAVLASAEDVQIFAVDTGGDDAGTLTSGTVQYRIVYEVLVSLDDAA